MQTFNPPVRPKTSNQTRTVKVISNDFGDGYDQEIADGLNPVRTEMELTWPVLTISQIQEIDAFFVTNAGKAFYFALPEENPRMWRCNEWSPPIERGTGSMTATLKEVFA